MSVTIRDIARESRVSIGTVSRVLHKKSNVTPGTARRVQSVIKRLGYDPLNNIPLAKRKGNNSVGLVLPDSGMVNPNGFFYSKAVFGLKKKLDDTPYHMVLLSNTQLEELMRQEHSGSVLGVDGLIFFCTWDNHDSQLQTLKKWNIPCVLIRRSTKVKGIIRITDDDYKGGRILARHLHELGHKNLGVIYPRNALTATRQDGFADYARENGLSLQAANVQPLAAGWEGRIRLILENMMESGDMVTGIFAFSDYCAIQVIRLLRERGLSVPEDVSVAGYDDTEAGNHFQPTITSIKIPIEEMLGTAAGMLINSMDHHKMETAFMEFANELMVRESSGPCKNK